MGDLAVGLLAGDHDDPPAADLDQSGVVGGISTTGVCGAQNRRPKGLRCLHGHHRSPRRSFDDDVVGIDPLDRVGHSNARHSSVGAISDRLDDCREEVRGSERARCIVHAHDRRIGWDGCQTGANRIAASRAAGDATFGGNVVWRNHHDHAVAGCPRRVGGAIDDASRADQFVLLGETSPRPGAGSDHDGPDILCCGERHDRRG